MSQGPIADPSESLERELREFFDATLVQQRVKFWAGVATSAVGVGVLLTALVAYLRDPASLSGSLMLGVAGVMAQLAAALMLSLHHKGLAQVLAGLEALRSARDTRVVVALVNRLNEKDRDELLISLSDRLMLRDESSREVSAQLVRALREQSNS